MCSDIYPKNKKLESIRKKFEEIDLVYVLDALGAIPNQDGDKHKYKSEKGNIIFKDNAWQNVNLGQKGYGGIFLVMHILDITFNDSIKWFIKNFGDEVDEKLTLETKSSGNLFSPPAPSKEATKITKDYLVQSRGLPESLIEREIAEKRIYGTHPINSKTGESMAFLNNGVFLGVNSAELRSVSGSKFNGCFDGSDTERSGYLVPNDKSLKENCLAITEAAIDALSYHTLFPSRFSASSNGSGRFNLHYRWATEAIDNDFAVFMAFDADRAGDIATQKLFNAISLRYLLSFHLRLEPSDIDDYILSNHIDFGAFEQSEDLFINYQENKILSEIFEKKLKIKFYIKKDIHEKFKASKELREYSLSKKTYEYITDKVKLIRHRPINKKDWNEELNLLGKDFIDKYEEFKSSSSLEKLSFYVPENLKKYVNSISGLQTNTNNKIS